MTCKSLFNITFSCSVYLRSHPHSVHVEYRKLKDSVSVKKLTYRRTTMDNRSERRGDVKAEAVSALRILHQEILDKR
jgi:hypothetical protein